MGSHIELGYLENESRVDSNKMRYIHTLYRRTYISKVLVKAFDVSMHDLERVQLVLTGGHTTDEIQRGITTVNYPGT